MEEHEYQPISHDDREAVKIAFAEKIKDCATGQTVLEKKEYRIKLKNETFITLVSDAELEVAADLAVDMVEELKRINITMHKSQLEELTNKVRNCESAVEQIIMMHSIFTDRMQNLFEQAADCMRVGGAYYMLLSEPLMTSAVFSAFNVLVDNGNDEEYYVSCVYFLLRSILKMHCILEA